MKSRDFCFWLQGYFEISCKDKPGLTEQQRVIIEKHLALVFKNEIDPSMGSVTHQEELNSIHKPQGKFGEPVIRC